MITINDARHHYTTPIEQGRLFDVVTQEDGINMFSRNLPDSFLEPQQMPIGEHKQYHSTLKMPSIFLKPRRISIFSFFAGAGFLDLGFESSNVKVVYVNEVYHPFLYAYRYAREQLHVDPPEYGYYEGSISDFIEEKKNRDLRELIQDARKSAEIVGFVGGPPCPDFSVGGKNKGKEGHNGKLSATYIELICQQKPDFYLFENVKGLWSTKRHREFFEEIKRKTQAAGYITTERLANAIEYGAPQNRDRVILLGFRRDLWSDMGSKLDSNLREFPPGAFPWEKLITYPKREAFAASWPTTHPFEEDSVIPCSRDVLQELTVEHWFKKNDVLNHPNAEHFFRPRAGIARFASVDEGDDSKKSFKRLHRWRYSPTACYGNNEVHLHPYKMRRISVAETLAIQSLPKDFVLPPSMTLTGMFKTVGNGVPYIMADGIAQTILEFFGGIKSHESHCY
jgi:DNA (cytosine-5)-methyltransferase 1